jgi:hypothetical protein
MRIWRVILVVVLGLYAYHVVYETYWSGSALQEERDQVALDEVRQWSLVMDDPNHSLIDVCVHTQIVAASYLQSGNDAKYHEWQKNVHALCPSGLN